MDKKVKEKRVAEKPAEKKEEKKLEKKEEKPKRYDKQTKIAVIIMLVLVVSVLLAHWIVQESRTFTYKGLNFYKEKEGAILYYKSLLGYATAGGGVPFLIKLRQDPREVGEIPIEGTIRLKNAVTLAISPTIGNCSDTYVTIIDFSRTLKAFSIKASAATTDKQYAKENEVDFANCKTTRPGTIIVMQEGNETRITQDGDCYTIEVKDCEIRLGFERFILEFIVNSMR